MYIFDLIWSTRWQSVDPHLLLSASAIINYRLLFSLTTRFDKCACTTRKPVGHTTTLLTLTRLDCDAGGFSDKTALAAQPMKSLRLLMVKWRERRVAANLRLNSAVSPSILHRPLRHFLCTPPACGVDAQCAVPGSPYSGVKYLGRVGNNRSDDVGLDVCRSVPKQLQCMSVLSQSTTINQQRQWTHFTLRSAKNPHLQMNKHRPKTQKFTITVCK